ncbi:MAG: ABC transporter substrate-binding protein, partial [Chloroflexi bacterium]|nr:ABC transporter substrate-binding protein [Chloroflexota bacterium]
PPTGASAATAQPAAATPGGVPTQAGGATSQAITTSQAVGPATSAATSQPAPHAGGTLRIGILGDIVSLDPHQLTPPIPDVTFSVWDRLLEYDSTVTPQPLLAESWDMSSDGRQIKLNLRQGVQFHTGREMTSDDVKWTFTRLRTDPVVAVTGFYTQSAPMASVDTDGTYGVVLKSDDPWPGVYDLLALMSVVDPVTMQGPNAKTQAIGTGPFKFVEWIQGDHLRFVRNEQYWASGQPSLDELYFQIFRDPQAMVTALEAGSIDAANKPPLVDAARLQSDQNFQVLTAQTGGTRYSFFFDTLSDPCSNQQFRQAMVYAIDRQRIVSSVLHGIGSACDLPFAPSSPAYDAAKDQFYTFDLDKAQSLLDASGVSDPSIDFSYSSVSTEWAGIAQIYQSDLAKIGVTLNLKPVDPVTLNTQTRSHAYTGVMTGINNLGQVSPTQLAFSPFYSPLVSFSGFKTDMLVQLADRLQHEVDPARQKQTYADWTDYVLDQVWAGQIATNLPVTALTAKVQGLVYNQLEMLDYRRAHL